MIRNILCWDEEYHSPVSLISVPMKIVEKITKDLSRAVNFTEKKPT